MGGSIKNPMLILRSHRILWMIVMLMFLRTLAWAQISPGELHQSHAFLEGVQNCNKCHGSDRALVPDKCLVCHSAIQQRLTDHSGLHGSQKYNECQTCHVEHQGKTFDLVYWKGGQKSFDHSLTGYLLEGKHATLECRACHTTKFISDTARLVADKITMSRTFMGLSPACTSCHVDEHRGQLSSTCAGCHNTTSWKPAAGFEHSKAKFALEGKHIDVPCAKCHLTVIDRRTVDDSSYVKFAGVAYSACTDCHTDVHKGKLGVNCTQCHSVQGWQVTNKAQFDHSKTRYPLEGKHASVACDKCHSRSEKRKELKFGACLDCHSDFHKGEFAKRPSKGACEECHSVAGYSPARFLLSQHDQTDYPLRGAHKAVPCDACHRKPATANQLASFQFQFSSTACLVCHADPHRGEVKKYVDDKGCQFCHSEDTWKQVSFDHNLTRFHLDGKHQSVACRPCHTGTIQATGETTVTFVGAGMLCQDCHKDPHRGQFVSADSNITACGSCHLATGWKPSTFDHNRSARFKLDGAHQNVQCRLCHKPTVVDGLSFVAYKPLDTACASCHGGSIPVEKERKP
jgi:hypothetical protein